METVWSVSKIFPMNIESPLVVVAASSRILSDGLLWRNIGDLLNISEPWKRKRREAREDKNSHMLMRYDLDPP